MGGREQPAEPMYHLQNVTCSKSPKRRPCSSSGGFNDPVGSRSRKGRPPETQEAPLTHHGCNQQIVIVKGNCYPLVSRFTNLPWYTKRSLGGLGVLQTIILTQMIFELGSNLFYAEFVTSLPRGGREVKPHCSYIINYPHPIGTGAPKKRIIWN